ncbi:hypothetical protein FF125_09150 [Aureibaculum algae]|uniref:Uncharacterized protein n=1 Tax=Aureibaculum algae TaxID=2584122 RepID=A0A5B7TQN1_9FLAO|nr:DUF5320 domain-containing protein [Aureibaculum algae]QCX38590.1 hypothetical protein FF125_09150 [Aureibaculum algae]
MPNLDQKGPGGLGPKTGKKLGRCKKNYLETKSIEENYFFNKKGLSNSTPTENRQNSIKKNE